MAVVNLLQACPVDLNHGGISDCNLATWKAVDVMIDKLSMKGSSSENIEGIFQAKLENSLMRYSGYKRQGFGVSLCRLIRVELFYGPKKWESEESFLRVVEKDNGILTRFVGVCGGVENISVNFLLEFGTKEDGQTKVEFKGALAIGPTKLYEITTRFSLTDTLAKNWEHGKFLGKMTLDLTLNDEALNLLHQDNNLADPVSNVVSKLLESVDSTGDGIIVAKNRKRVRCHKAILISQNEIFKKFFKKEEHCQNGDILKMNDMTEAGVRALLAYLYCRDIKDALKCSFTAWELVMAADKYEINGLLESMKDVMYKGSDWFSASAALCLWSFAKKKIDSVPENDRGYKEILDKAVSALRSKPKQELEQCPEFKEMLRSTETAQELCLFFILNK